MHVLEIVALTLAEVAGALNSGAAAIRRVRNRKEIQLS